MYGDIPEAFQLVDLRDRHTWHRATLREWVDLRQEVVRVQEKQKTHQSEYLKARQAALKQLWEETGYSRKKKKPPIEGPFLERLNEILRVEFVEKNDAPQRLSDWQKEFLRASEWIEEFFEEYHKGFGPSTLVGLLAEWVWNIEDEYSVAEMRSQKRNQMVVKSSGRKIRAGNNTKLQYLPHPLELIRIYLAARILVQRLEISIKRIGTKWQTRPDLNRVVAWDVLHFMRQLRRLDYSTFREADDAVLWTGWNQLGKTPRAELAKKFLAMLFNATPNTIKRKISKSSLTTMYQQHYIPEEFTLYLDNHRPLVPTQIFERGWYLRPEDLELVPSIPQCSFFPAAE